MVFFVAQMAMAFFQELAAHHKNWQDGGWNGRSAAEWVKGVDMY